MGKLQLPVVKKQGLRVTPADQIDIITGALAGSANKTLLSWATQFGLNGVGLSLGDGQLVKVTQINEELGHVGMQLQALLIYLIYYWMRAIYLLSALSV